MVLTNPKNVSWCVAPKLSNSGPSCCEQLARIGSCSYRHLMQLSLVGQGYKLFLCHGRPAFKYVLLLRHGKYLFECLDRSHSEPAETSGAEANN